MIKLRILRWGNFPGHPGGPNIMTRALIRGGKRVRMTGAVTTKSDVSDDTVGRWPGAKECGMPLKAGNGCPGRVAQLARTSSHAPKGFWFDSQSG